MLWVLVWAQELVPMLRVLVWAQELVLVLVPMLRALVWAGCRPLCMLSRSPCDCCRESTKVLDDRHRYIQCTGLLCTERWANTLGLAAKCNYHHLWRAGGYCLDNCECSCSTTLRILSYWSTTGYHGQHL